MDAIPTRWQPASHAGLDRHRWRHILRIARHGRICGIDLQDKQRARLDSMLGSLDRRSSCSRNDRMGSRPPAVDRGSVLLATISSAVRAGRWSRGRAAHCLLANTVYRAGRGTRHEGDAIGRHDRVRPAGAWTALALRRQLPVTRLPRHGCRSFGHPDDHRGAPPDERCQTCHAYGRSDRDRICGRNDRGTRLARIPLGRSNPRHDVRYALAARETGSKQRREAGRHGRFRLLSRRVARMGTAHRAAGGVVWRYAETCDPARPDEGLGHRARPQCPAPRADIASQRCRDPQ